MGKTKAEKFAKSTYVAINTYNQRVSRMTVSRDVMIERLTNEARASVAIESPGKGYRNGNFD